NLFSTHPNTENRIAELQEQAQEMGLSGGQAMPAQSGNPTAETSAGPWGQRASGQQGGRRGPWG
ncbi:MAG: protease HtpX, partial [Pseudomonadota bacterium]